MISISKSKFAVLGFVFVALMLIPVNDAFADHTTSITLETRTDGGTEAQFEVHGNGIYDVFDEIKVWIDKDNFNSNSEIFKQFSTPFNDNQFPIEVLKVNDGYYMIFVSIDNLSDGEHKVKIDAIQTRHGPTRTLDGGDGISLIVGNPTPTLTITNLSHYNCDSPAPPNHNQNWCNGTDHYRIDVDGVTTGFAQYQPLTLNIISSNGTNVHQFNEFHASIDTGAAFGYEGPVFYEYVSDEWVYTPQFNDTFTVTICAPEFDVCDAESFTIDSIVEDTPADTTPTLTIDSLSTYKEGSNLMYVINGNTPISNNIEVKVLTPNGTTNQVHNFGTTTPTYQAGGAILNPFNADLWEVQICVAEYDVCFVEEFTINSIVEDTPADTSNFFFESLDITGDSDTFGPSIIVVVGESWHVTPTLAWEGTLPDSFPTGEPVIHGEFRYMAYANGTSAPSEQMGGTLYGSVNWSGIFDNSANSIDYDAKTITLSTWSEKFHPYSDWPIGGYLVTITADTGNVLSETNESDNVIERLDIWSSCDHPPWDADVCVTDSPSTDTTPPVVSVPNNLTFTGSNFGNNVILTKTISSPEFASAGNVTAIDDVDGNIPVSCDGWYGINWQEASYSLGTTTITCSAIDSSENEGSASFTITVTDPSTDTTPPVITVPTSWTNSTSNPDGMMQYYSVLASDDVGLFGIDQCSNSIQNHQELVLRDQVILEWDNGNPWGWTYLDWTSGNPEGWTDVGYGPEEVVGQQTTAWYRIDTPIGTTTVTCDVTDSSGYTASASFTITIVDSSADTTPPVIIVPPDLVFGLTYDTNHPKYGPPAGYGSGKIWMAGESRQLETWEINNIPNWLISATDDNGDTWSVQWDGTYTGSPGQRFTYSGPSWDTTGIICTDYTLAPTGSFGFGWWTAYSLGTHEIRCTLADQEGNVGTASFKITMVEDDFSIEGVAPVGYTPQSYTPVIPQPPTPDMPQILANHTITTVAESGFSLDCADTGCYTPSTLTVDVGDLINMTNTDPTGVHTFTSGTVDGFTPNPNGVFDSDVLMSGDSFAWTPQTDVDQPYYCMLHTWMVGTIVVGGVDDNAAAAEAAAAEAAAAEAAAAEEAAAEAAAAEAAAAEEAAAEEAAELAAEEAATDNTPPEFEEVNNILVDATTSNGAVVNYELPQAIDDDSGVELGPDCSPASGSFFTIGTTEVTCYAADWAENIGTTSFTVTVTSLIAAPVEITTDVSITIGKSDYNTKEAIFVTGIATPFTENNVSIQVEDSLDNVVLVEQITPESSGVYTGIIFPNFLWSTSGNYTMSATYGNSTANTSFGFEFIESVIDEYLSPTGITLQTDTSMYAIGDTIIIESALTDVGSDYQIGIFVEDPTGELRVIQFLNTDDSGSVSLSLKAQDNWIPGKYFVIASDTLAYDTLGDSENTRESVSFDLVKPIPEITISPTVTTTESGNTITSYDAGDMAYFSTSLLSESTSDVLVTINVVDADDTTLGVAFFKSIIGKGNSELVLGFKIPEDAADGAAKIYVNTYTDWIDNGGIVIGSELLSEVNIDGVIIEVVEETVVEEVVEETVLPENTIPRLSTVTDITQLASFTTGSVVSYSLPLATSGATTLDATCTPAPGSMFPIGSTQVTCTATNDFGNTGMTSFMITINPVVQTADQSLSVKVGKDLYNNLEPLFVTGSVGTVTGEPINLEVRDTQNNLISIEQVTPKESGVYSGILTSNELWDNTGEYTIIAKYAGVIALDTFEFELIEVEEVIPEKIPTSLFIDTLDSAYVLGDVVAIGVNLVDAGAGESILLEIKDSQNDQVLIQSLNTDSNGIAVFLHQLDSSGEPGVYSVTAVSDEWNFSNSENFIAVAQIPDITIGDVVSTLQDGTEVDSFESGDMGYFQTPIISESVSNVLITVNIFDVENTPLGLAYFNSKVVDDTFDITLGLQIPQDAAPGLATVYINTYTDWVSEGGVPILEEQVSFIEITPSSTTSLNVSSEESEPTAEVELIPITGNISVNTESTSYTTGNTIVISGSIQNLTEYEQPVVIIIVSPDGNLVTIDQVSHDSSGNYSTTVTAGGTMNSSGEYEIRAQYGVNQITSTFDFTKN